MIKAVAIFLVFGTVCAEMPAIWVDEPVINPKIIKGENANEGEFPYMVSLRLNGRHVCGGSILTKNWALTASHCCAVGNPSNLALVSGSIYQNQGGSNHPITKLIKHENYQPNQNWRNDVCLIHISRPFQFSNKVKQITLPPQGWNLNHGDKLAVSGWGYTTPNKPQQIPNRMQKATSFTYVESSACAQETGVNMFAGYLCARGAFKGQGVCNGDSGSPIVKNGVQVGVASFVFLPCGNGRPDFFARVPNYIDWIKQKLGPEAGELQFTR